MQWQMWLTESFLSNDQTMSTVVFCKKVKVKNKTWQQNGASTERAWMSFSKKIVANDENGNMKKKKRVLQKK